MNRGSCKILYTISVTVSSSARTCRQTDTNLITCTQQLLVLQLLDLLHESVNLRLRLLQLCRYSVDIVSTLVQFFLQLCHTGLHVYYMDDSPRQAPFYS